MTRQVNVRLDDIHLTLLDEMVKQTESLGFESSRTDTIQRAIYSLANNVALGESKTAEIIQGVLNRRYEITEKGEED